MGKVDIEMTIAELSTALGTLLDLGVDLNTFDEQVEQGNTIFNNSYNIILLGLYNHSDKTLICLTNSNTCGLSYPENFEYADVIL